MAVCLTLERLILSTLAEGQPVTAREVSSLWGEDVVRCDGWLKTFAKRGLCTASETAAKGRSIDRRGQFDRTRYIPTIPELARHLAALGARA